MAVIVSYGVSSEHLGGKHRAETARRDKFGRFLPNYGEIPLPLKHGQAGGIARSTRCKRDARGRFTK
jgi:hypothetical protein